jgi:hypothetical protein
MIKQFSAESRESARAIRLSEIMEYSSDVNLIFLWPYNLLSEASHAGAHFIPKKELSGLNPPVPAKRKPPGSEFSKNISQRQQIHIVNTEV